MNQGYFKQCGRQGGVLRAHRLSPLRRTAIAAWAARARWAKGAPPQIMPSIRLQGAAWDNPVYLEEILEEGDLQEWRDLYRRIDDQPFGATAMALEKVLVVSQSYGVIPLWKGILKRVQAS